MPVTRTANINDIEQLAVLFDQYRVFCNKDSDLDGAQQFLRDRINTSDSIIFVSEIESRQLVGFVQLYPLFSSTRMKKLWLLNDLFVHIEARGKGVSSQLVEHAKELAKETKACAIILEAEKSNKTANLIYPKMGFELTEGSYFYEWHNK